MKAEKNVSCETLWDKRMVFFSLCSFVANDNNNHHHHRSLKITLPIDFAYAKPYVDVLCLCLSYVTCLT